MLARVLEEKGISTVTLNMFKEVALQIKPPRTIITDFPFGAPFGPPNNENVQMTLVKECLKVLDKEEAGVYVEFLDRWED